MMYNQFSFNGQAARVQRRNSELIIFFPFLVTVPQNRIWTLAAWHLPILMVLSCVCTQVVHLHDVLALPASQADKERACLRPILLLSLG